MRTNEKQDQKQETMEVNMRKQIIVSIVTLLLIITVAIPASATDPNSDNTYITSLVVEGYGGDAIFQYAREKRDDSAMYLEITDMTYYSVRVRALGTNSEGYSNTNNPETLTVSNTLNCTCYIWDWEINWPYVLCLEDIDYSIHSSVYEHNKSYATYGFTNVYNSYTYISGEWSPDSIYSHTDAYYPG